MDTRAQSTHPFATDINDVDQHFADVSQKADKDKIHQRVKRFPPCEKFKKNKWGIWVCSTVAGEAVVSAASSVWDDVSQASRRTYDSVTRSMREIASEVERAWYGWW